MLNNYDEVVVKATGQVAQDVDEETFICTVVGGPDGIGMCTRTPSNEAALFMMAQAYVRTVASMVVEDRVYECSIRGAIAALTELEESGGKGVTLDVHTNDMVALRAAVKVKNETKK